MSRVKKDDVNGCVVFKEKVGGDGGDKKEGGEDFVSMRNLVGSDLLLRTKGEKRSDFRITRGVSRRGVAKTGVAKSGVAKRGASKRGEWCGISSEGVKEECEGIHKEDNEKGECVCVPEEEEEEEEEEDRISNRFSSFSFPSSRLCCLCCCRWVDDVVLLLNKDKGRRVRGRGGDHGRVRVNHSKTWVCETTDCISHVRVHFHDRFSSSRNSICFVNRH